MLTAVTAVNEIVGPILARYALVRAGEVNRDRVRLIDFLQEENIVTDFRASTKEEAIGKLVDLMLATITSCTRSRPRRASCQRAEREEQEASTCLGGGLAYPTASCPRRTPMVGVMALSREGLGSRHPDHRPVHCMVLLGTAEEERDRHLQVLASLARTVGIDDPPSRSSSSTPESPAHAYELLHGEESEDFNYFLEED